MRRRFAIVFNARAGVAWPRLLSSTLKRLEAAGAEVTRLKTGSAEDATRQVKALTESGRFDAVIAAGGDGTFRAVASGAAGTSLPVGFVPLGTGNVLKYEIGLSGRAASIAETLLSGPVMDAEGGLVNGAPFFLMVGAGFDGRIVAALNQKAKRLLGRLTYGGPIAKTLIRGPDDLVVTVDGTAHEASWVIVSNASRYGGSFTLTRDTRLGKPGFVAIIVQGKSRFALLKASLALALGRLAAADKRPRGVLAIPARNVVIESHKPAPVPVEVDGDEAGTTPVEVRAGGVTVRLIVPDAYVADLTDRHTNRLPSRA